MRALFSPAVALMNTLTYSGRLALAGFLAFAAIVVLLLSLASQLQDAITLSQNELATIEVIAPLQEQIRLTQQHRGLSAGYLSGAAALQDRLDSKRREVGIAIAAVDRAETQHSHLLRSGEEWRSLKNEWARLAGDENRMSVAESLRAHSQLIERLLRFQVRLADAGGLTLDSDIATYYLAEATYRSLPEMLEVLGKMRARGTSILVKRSLGDSDVVELAAHEAILKQKLEALQQDLGKAGLHSPELAPALSRFAGELGSASEQLLALLQRDILARRFSVAPAQFYERYTTVMDVGYAQMFQGLLPALQHKLTARAHELRLYLGAQIGIASLFLLLLAYVSIGAYYSIIEAVKKLSAGAEAVAQGNLQTTIALEGRGELATVADQFNRMATALDKSLSESRQTAAALAEALAAAKRADQAKDALLANVSHELRTPLNAVIGFTVLALRPKRSTEKLRDYLQKIADASKTLASVIDDLLDLSKIAAGRMELDPVMFRFRELIARCRSTLSFKLEQRGLHLIDQIGDDVPDVLYADSRRIEQILLNLLSNAAKFSERGSIVVRARAQAEGEAVRLHIEVQDSGIGMSEAEMERLFQPFSQADASITRKYGGTGLGLAICKQLATMMDGDIGVASSPASGTTFSVALKLERGDALRLGREEEADKRRADLVNYENTRVLAVDDQPMNREIVAEILGSVGIEVRLACDGQEALDIIDQEQPGAFDLILMDIQMPVMDGLCATRELRARPAWANVPIIAMTAHTMEHERQISAAAGMNDHIGKPFDADHFYRVLARWIAADKHRVMPTAPPLAAARAATPGLRQRLEAIAGIDVAAALPRFGAKEGRYLSWLADFAGNAGELPATLRQELAAGASAAALQAVHKFKGRVGMLGMEALHGQVAALELALRQGSAGAALIDQLDSGIAAMSRQIEQLLADLDAAAGSAAPPPAPQLQWDDAYAVGVAAIDAQHRGLLEMINRLGAAQGLEPDAATAALHEALARMADYTQVHFKTEEAHLSSIGYAEFAAHSDEHLRFIEKLSAFCIAASCGVLRPADVHAYLVGWFNEHVLATDARYAQRTIA